MRCASGWIRRTLLRAGEPEPSMDARALTGTIDAIAPAAGEAGTLEARVRLAPESGLRAGTMGEARIPWRRGTLLAAIAWQVRSRVRSDLVL